MEAKIILRALLFLRHLARNDRFREFTKKLANARSFEERKEIIQEEWERFKEKFQQGEAEIMSEADLRSLHDLVTGVEPDADVFYESLESFCSSELFLANEDRFEALTDEDLSNLAKLPEEFDEPSDLLPNVDFTEAIRGFLTLEESTQTARADSRSDSDMSDVARELWDGARDASHLEETTDPPNTQIEPAVDGPTDNPIEPAGDFVERAVARIAVFTNREDDQFENATSSQTEEMSSRELSPEAGAAASVWKEETETRPSEADDLSDHDLSDPGFHRSESASDDVDEMDNTEFM